MKNGQAHDAVGTMRRRARRRGSAAKTTLIAYPSPFLIPTVKETPVVDYPPYPSASTPEAARLFQRLTVQVHALIHYQSTPSWFIDRRTLEERLFFVLRGRSRFVIGENEYSLQAGDCIHLRRGVPHSASTDPHDPIEFISMRYTARLFDSLLLGDVFPFPDHISLAGDMPFLPLLKEGCRQFVLRPPGWQQSLDALGVCLLLWLLQEKRSSQSVQWQSGRTSDLQRLVPALHAMQANLKQPLSSRAMARHCGLSEEQFRRIFRRALGTSPAAYSRRLRMEKACYLLHHTDETIEAIAARVGYPQLTSFLHAFKKLMGVSPGQYRHSTEE
jgi:AraC-like DNA-binding protein/mannose-6-phosphate isomerase-like protein (cupin superfamily)